MGARGRRASVEGGSVLQATGSSAHTHAWCSALDRRFLQDKGTAALCHAGRGCSLPRGCGCSISCLHPSLLRAHMSMCSAAHAGVQHHSKTLFLMRPLHAAGDLSPCNSLHVYLFCLSLCMPCAVPAQASAPAWTAGLFAACAAMCRYLSTSLHAVVYVFGQAQAHLPWIFLAQAWRTTRWS